MKTFPFSDFVEFWDSNKGREACSLIPICLPNSLHDPKQLYFFHHHSIEFALSSLPWHSDAKRAEVLSPSLSAVCHPWSCLRVIPRHSRFPGPPLRLPNYSFPVSLTVMPPWSYPSLHLYFKIIFLAGILGPIPTSVVFFLKFTFTSFIEA